MARILVVEDDDGVAAYLVDMLVELAGYEVDRAATADGAVERVKGSLSLGGSPYDLVLMDMLLQGRRREGDEPTTKPSANGAVTTLALRALGYHGPVVVITGNLASIDKEIEAAAGFAGRLLKPALPRDVLPEVARHIAAAAEVQKKNILVVEDDVAVAKTMLMVLQSAGYEVEIAPTGEDAIDMLTRKTYALAMVDLKLPGISGSDVALRIQDAGLATPLVAVSGFNVDESIVGFKAVVSKPLSLSRLLSIADEYAPIGSKKA